MSAPRPPPRRRKQDNATPEKASGSAYNAVRQIATTPNMVDKDRNAPLSVNILNEVPETIIGANVSITGDFHFNSLLRIEGHFEGVLLSKGDLVVANHGVVIGNIENMGTVVVLDGKVNGNIDVDRLILQGFSTVHGDITCKSIVVDPEVVIVGSLNVHRRAPARVNFDGEIIPDSPPKEQQMQAVPSGKELGPIVSKVSSNKSLESNKSVDTEKLMETSHSLSSLASNKSIASVDPHSDIHKEKVVVKSEFDKFHNQAQAKLNAVEDETAPGKSSHVYESEPGQGYVSNSFEVNGKGDASVEDTSPEAVADQKVVDDIVSNVAVAEEGAKDAKESEDAGSEDAGEDYADDPSD